MTVRASDRAGISIRPAERADLLDVLRIETQSFPQPWPYAAFDRFLDKPGFLVATDESQVVGYVVADTDSDYGRAVGHIKDIAVHPERRSRGIGSRLLRQALRVLAHEGARRAKLEVREANEGAIALYRRFGFTAHHVVPGYYDDGEDAVVYTADLDP